jgi:hypothetical protein
MAENSTLDRQARPVRSEQTTPDEQGTDLLSTLNEPWFEMTRRRSWTASFLAIGLLILYALVMVGSGAAITMLIFISFFSNRPITDFITGIGQILDFIKVLLPFIATPLGVALGYYFRESQSD